MARWLSTSLLLTTALQFGHCQFELTNIARTTVSYVEQFRFFCESNQSRMCVWSKLTDGTSDRPVFLSNYVTTMRDYSLRLQTPPWIKLYPLSDVPTTDDNDLSMSKMKWNIANFVQVARRAFDTLHFHIGHPDSVSDEVLVQLLRRECVDVDDILTKTISSVVPTANDQSDQQSFPVLYAEIRKNMTTVGTNTTIQQFLLEVYEMITIAETKSVMVLTFCKKLQRSMARGWNAVKKSLIDSYKRRYNVYLTEFLKGIAEASRTYRACDPPTGWTKGVSYFELDRFNQATMFRRGRYISPCNRHADDLNYTGIRKLCQGSSSEREDCYFMEEHICWGTLFNCFYFWNATICPLEDDPKRFLWLTIDSGRKTYGDSKAGCALRLKRLDEQLCMCHCLESRNQISLVMSRSDVKRSRVIVAVRLAYQENTIFIQIKEGKLGPNGTIAKVFKKWRPSTPNLSHTVPIKHVDDSINLNGLAGQDDELLTAVGFVLLRKCHPSEIAITIEVAKFDCQGGLQRKTRSILPSVFFNDLLDVTPDNPIHSHGPQLPSNTSTHYMKFQRSYLSRDAGQTTLPLFDSVPVETVPIAALSGVALIHKGTPNFAGFLSLKITTLNIFRCLNESMRLLTTDNN